MLTKEKVEVYKDVVTSLVILSDILSTRLHAKNA